MAIAAAFAVAAFFHEDHFVLLLVLPSCSTRLQRSD